MEQTAPAPAALSSVLMSRVSSRSYGTCSHTRRDAGGVPLNPSRKIHLAPVRAAYRTHQPRIVLSLQMRSLTPWGNKSTPVNVSFAQTPRPISLRPSNSIIRSNNKPEVNGSSIVFFVFIRHHHRTLQRDGSNIQDPFRPSQRGYRGACSWSSSLFLYVFE